MVSRWSLSVRHRMGVVMKRVKTTRLLKTLSDFLCCILRVAGFSPASWAGFQRMLSVCNLALGCNRCSLSAMGICKQRLIYWPDLLKCIIICRQLIFLPCQWNQTFACVPFLSCRNSKKVKFLRVVGFVFLNVSWLFCRQTCRIIASAQQITSFGFEPVL